MLRVVIIVSSDIAAYNLVKELVLEAEKILKALSLPSHHFCATFVVSAAVRRTVLFCLVRQDTCMMDVSPLPPRASFMASSNYLPDFHAEFS